MTNIEIKARYEDAERAEENLNSLGAGMAGTFHQKDTYFNVERGRLKLRELGSDEGHLIFFRSSVAHSLSRATFSLTFVSGGVGINASKLNCFIPS